MKAQEEDDKSQSGSYDELDAMESLIMNVREASPEADDETPYDAEGSENVNENAKVHVEQRGRFDPYSMTSTSENIQIDMSTTALTGHK